MAAAALVVGIDIAKAELAVALHPSGAAWTVPHTEAGIRTRTARLPPLAPTLVVCEATGGLETALVGTLAAAGRPPARRRQPPPGAGLRPGHGAARED